MLDFKRLISMVLVLGFIANTKATNNNNDNISMHDKKINNYLSKTEEFESKKKDINENSYDKFSKKAIFDQYKLCEEALKEQKNNVLYWILGMCITPLIPTIPLGTLLYLNSKNSKEEFFDLRVLNYKDVTDKTLNYQKNISYDNFKFGNNFTAKRTDIKCYTDALKHFGNRPFVNFLLKTLSPWSFDTIKKVLEYLRLSGILGWSQEDVLNKKDKIDSYLVAVLAKLALESYSKDKKIKILDLETEFYGLLPSLIYVSNMSDFSNYTFTFCIKNDENPGENIQGEYIIYVNSQNNKFVIFPIHGDKYYYILDMNSNLEGNKEYPSLSRFFICESKCKDKAVIKSIYVPYPEKVQLQL